MEMRLSLSEQWLSLAGQWHFMLYWDENYWDCPLLDTCIPHGYEVTFLLTTAFLTVWDEVSLSGHLQLKGQNRQKGSVQIKQIGKQIVLDTQNNIFESRPMSNTEAASILLLKYANHHLSAHNLLWGYDLSLACFHTEWK
jgi:hypothetical protein